MESMRWPKVETGVGRSHPDKKLEKFTGAFYIKSAIGTQTTGPLPTCFQNFELKCLGKGECFYPVRHREALGSWVYHPEPFEL